MTTEPLIDDTRYEHLISVVIPVYQGEKTLSALLAEIAPLTAGFATPAGHSARIGEVILVHDRGPDRSDEVIRTLTAGHPFVKAVWLSRNFGQHAATLAGIASSGGAWIVTMDEDGQHDPAYIASILDTALAENASVVYAKAENPPPHGFFRNTSSKLAKRVLDSAFGGGRATDFNSYRLILGDIGRSVAAYAGTSVYLDVALTWVTDRVTTSPVLLRQEGDRRSGYSLMRLLGHFWRMVLTSGTRGLRLVTITGAVFALLGLVYAIYLTIARFVSGDVPEGWTSQMVLTAVGIGLVLIALGIIAEYVGVAVNMAMGKPPYLIVRDFDSGPLGRRHRDS
jgi:glycosyltransferase involved in cell wall biosynthesis